MAATDLTAVAIPPCGFYTVRVSLEASAGNAREVQLPAWGRRYDIVFKQSDGTSDDAGKIASAGTDGAAIGNDHLPIASGGTYTIRVVAGQQKGGGSIFLAAATNSAYAHICIQQD